MEDGAILFFERRAAGPDGDKALGPVEGAEGADDLEFDLGDSHFVFGVIVGEGDLRIREKAQDLLFPFVQASNAVNGAGLWRFPGIAIGRFPGVELMRCLQDLSIFFAELGEALRVDSFGMLFGFLESLEQKLAHLQGPGLLVDLLLELELAEVMGVAQGVEG